MMLLLLQCSPIYDTKLPTNAGSYTCGQYEQLIITHSKTVVGLVLSNVAMEVYFLPEKPKTQWTFVLKPSTVHSKSYMVIFGPQMSYSAP